MINVGLLLVLASTGCTQTEQGHEESTMVDPSITEGVDCVAALQMVLGSAQDLSWAQAAVGVADRVERGADSRLRNALLELEATSGAAQPAAAPDGAVTSACERAFEVELS